MTEANFSGHVTLVTGGAGAIGAAITRRLLRAGAEVVWTDIDPLAEARADPEIRSRGHFLCHDVGAPEDWAAVEAYIGETFGRLDGLVNNAGIYRRENIEDASVESVRRVMRVNLEGAMLGCQMALRLMGDTGSIVNVASVAGLKPGSQTLSYGISKAALLNLTQSVARYAIDRKRKIRCNAICPGSVETAMSEEALEGVNPAIVDKLFRQSTVQGRMAQPKEIASMAVFLLSPEASFATGAPFLMDGGLML